VFQRHEEESAVATFAKALKAGVEQFNLDPLGVPLIPNWARVLAAIPDAGDQLLEAIATEGGVLSP
jgi:glucosyl-3-phosphoglycerate synthase